MLPKILINVPGYGGSRQAGVARVCFSLLQALVQRGRYSYALRTAYAPEDLPPSLRTGAIEVVTIPLHRHKFLGIFQQTFGVPSLARKIGATAVLNMDYQGLAFGGPPRAMIVHDVFPRTLPDQYGLRYRLQFGIVHQIATRTSRALVAISETTAQDLARFYPAARGKTVVISLDTTLNTNLAPQAPMAIAQPYILTVANGTPNKNLAAIGRAIELLDQRGVSVRLVHVGHDPKNTIQHAAGGGLKHAEVVRLTGVGDETLVQLYRGAVCYVNTSLYEGFCLPIIEAQKLGCPVICSDRSATAEVAGDSAILCDPTDASALAAHIERVLRHEALRDELRAAGLRNAARFSWATSAAAFEALFDRLAINAAPL